MTLQWRTLNTDVKFSWLDTPADSPGAEHWEVLQRTAELIPIPHRSLIHHVELRGHGESPSHGGGNNPATRTIRLSHACLRETYNRHYNVTMLHELGHLVNARYDVVGYARRQGADGQALLHTRHEGATHGPDEQIADCYMVYLIQVVAAHRYTHRADPAAYQGAAAQMRFNLLLHSGAFEGTPGVAWFRAIHRG